MAALGGSQADACRAANHYQGGHCCPCDGDNDADNADNGDNGDNDDNDQNDDYHKGEPCCAAVQALAGLIVED